MVIHGQCRKTLVCFLSENAQQVSNPVHIAGRVYCFSRYRLLLP